METDIMNKDASLFKDIYEFYTYEEFMAFVAQLVAEGKTSGAFQTESLIAFTRLNHQRMQRWDKTFVLQETLAAKLQHAKPQIWWVITEAWCGDSAQSLPGIVKMATASNGKIDLRIILRDEHLDVMDKYLTNGGRSIPKIVSVDTAYNELFNWGPRPAAGQKLMMDWKVNPAGKSHDEIERELHTWYARDKGESLQREFEALLFP